MKIQELLLVMCVAGMVGPIMLYALNRTLSREVSGLIQVAQGGALMVIASVSLAMSGWADASFATYAGSLLLVAAGGYWYEGIRQIGGQKQTYRSTRAGVGIYSVGLGVLTYSHIGERGLLTYNALGCGVILFACMYAGLESKLYAKWKLATAWSMGAGGVLFIVQGVGLAADGIHGIEEVSTLGAYLAIAIYLAIQVAMVGVAMTASERVQRTLQKEATTDYLSGLLLRGELIDRGNVEMTRCLREGKVIGFLMMDIDHFKGINDTYGHQVGDKVIADFAKKISGLVRPYDLVGRYGGEEFVAILPGASEWIAKNIGERIRQLAEKDGDGLPKYTVSVGVCCGKKGTVGSMIGYADKALYDAKRSGRNKVVVSSYGRERPPLVLIQGQVN